MIHCGPLIPSLGSIWHKKPPPKKPNEKDSPISFEEVEPGEFRVRGQPGLHTDLSAHWQAYENSRPASTISWLFLCRKSHPGSWTLYHLQAQRNAVRTMANIAQSTFSRVNTNPWYGHLVHTDNFRLSIFLWNQCGQLPWLNTLKLPHPTISVQNFQLHH